MLILGSCNWTVSSRANSEFGAEIALTKIAERELKEAFEDRLSKGVPFGEASRRSVSVSSRSASRGRSKTPQGSDGST